MCTTAGRQLRDLSGERLIQGCGGNDICSDGRAADQCPQWFCSAMWHASADVLDKLHPHWRMQAALMRTRGNDPMAPSLCAG